jgi:hypothetical protein
MVTMATGLFCLNTLLKSLRYFHVVFLWVVLRVKIFNLTIRDTNSKYCPDGMTLVPWIKGQPLVWDVTVVDTLADSYVLKSSEV